jgi:hypothetical protein
MPAFNEENASSSEIGGLRQLENVNAEMERGEEKCTRHHHQTMLEMGGEVNVRMMENRRSTHTNFPNDDFRGCTSELCRFS